MIESLLSATTFHDVQLFIIVGIVFIIAGIVYATLGFGFGLVSVSLLGLILTNMQDVVVIILLVSLPFEFYIVLRKINVQAIRESLGIIAGMVIGVPLGTLFLKNYSPDILKIVLAIALMTISLSFFLFKPKKSYKLPFWSVPLFGIVAGALGGALGVAGPPLIVYFQLTEPEKSNFRYKLLSIFAMLSIMRLISFGTAHLLTTPRIMSSLYLLPISTFAWIIGNNLHFNISQEWFRRIVNACLFIIAILLLCKV